MARTPALAATATPDLQVRGRVLFPRHTNVALECDVTAIIMLLATDLLELMPLTRRDVAAKIEGGDGVVAARVTAEPWR